MSNQVKLYGWYSKQQEVYTGTNIYRCENGLLTTVTSVGYSPDGVDTCNFTDKESRGCVTTWVRRGKKPKEEPFFFEMGI